MSIGMLSVKTGLGLAGTVAALGAGRLAEVADCVLTWSQAWTLLRQPQPQNTTPTN